MPQMIKIIYNLSSNSAICRTQTYAGPKSGKRRNVDEVLAAHLRKKT